MPGQGAEHNVGHKAAFHRHDHQPLTTNDRRSRLQQVTTPTLWEPTTGTPVTSPLVEPIEGQLIPREDVKLLRERMQRYGAVTLSTNELLTISLRTGQGSEQVVSRIDTLLSQYSLHQLLNADFGELCNQYHLGEAKAAQLQAMLEMARRLTLPSKDEKYTIRSVYDAVRLVRPEMELLDHEEMRVLLLDTKYGVVANHRLYQGTVNSTVLRAGEIFRPAVSRNCPGIMLFHNHPTGNPEPSPEDIATTEQLIHAGLLLDVELVDHIIIGSNNRFVSLKERLHW